MYLPCRHACAGVRARLSVAFGRFSDCVALRFFCDRENVEKEPLVRLYGYDGAARAPALCFCPNRATPPVPSRLSHCPPARGGVG